MTLTEHIAADTAAAMKRKEASVVDTLRMLRAAIKNAEIEKHEALTDEEVIAVLGTMLKQLRDARAQFVSGQREDLVTKTDAEIAVLSGYVPAQLTDEEIDAVITESIAAVGAQGMKDFGKVMGMVSQKTKGRAEGSRVSERVRGALGTT